MLCWRVGGSGQVALVLSVGSLLGIVEGVLWRGWSPREGGIMFIGLGPWYRWCGGSRVGLLSLVGL